MRSEILGGQKFVTSYEISRHFSGWQVVQKIALEKPSDEGLAFEQIKNLGVFKTQKEANTQLRKIKQGACPNCGTILLNFGKKVENHFCPFFTKKQSPKSLSNQRLASLMDPWS